jgi:hypothetical protein
MRHIRYRDFVDLLQSASDEDKGARIIKSREIGITRDAWLSLIPGKDGGIAILTTQRGTTPQSAGVTFRLDPTTTCTALAAALSTAEMMALARSLLTPGCTSPRDTLDFAQGLSDLTTNPFSDDDNLPPVTKPPSLDADLWNRIPHDQRRDYFKAMARGIIRGIHPDDTVAKLLSAA